MKHKTKDTEVVTMTTPTLMSQSKHLERCNTFASQRNTFLVEMCWANALSLETLIDIWPSSSQDKSGLYSYIILCVMWYFSKQDTGFH